MRLNRRHLLTSLPILGGAALGLGFHKMLHQMQKGNFDPHAINNGLVGQNIPNFTPIPSLPLYHDRTISSLTPSLLSQQKRPLLLNFLASWCIPCVAELPFLKEISQEISIWGIAYKDKTERITHFLQRNHNPYHYVAQDLSGYCAIDWGVTGVPETFLILPGGKISLHINNALDQNIYQNQIRPLLQNPS